MSNVRLDEPMSFPDAAYSVGWRRGSKDAAGRRLLRRCLKRESELGRQFVVRDRRGRPIRVTIGDLHRYLPECRPSRVEELAASIRPYVAAMDARTLEVVRDEIQSSVEPRLVDLDSRLTLVEKWKALTEDYIQNVRRLVS